MPATPALAIQQTVERGELIDWWHGALGELHATAQAERLAPAGATGGLFNSELYQHDRGLATVYLPVAGAARQVGRATPTTIPAAELAISTHHGALNDIDIVYGHLGSYGTERQISIDGPPREYYLRDAHEEPDPGRWVTEIGWPIFRVDNTDTSHSHDTATR